jgi:uncharacterized protein
LTNNLQLFLLFQHLTTAMKKLLSLIFLNLFFTAFAFSQQLDTPINTIQGDGNISPRVGVQVSTRGIVTAITKKGFYIQTPDADADKTAKTSEGIYVFCKDKDSVPAEAVVGNLVQVFGKVAEYTPRGKAVLSLTQIVFSRIQFISKDNPLPAPIILTATDLDSTGKVDQMERFEGMRVKINALTVSGGTGGRIDDNKFYGFSDGVFFGVLSGTPRPFREPGIDLLSMIIRKMDKTLPYFDMNPEMLRVDSDSQNGTKKLEVTAGATVKNLTGVIDYYNTYTLSIDPNSNVTVEGNKVATPVAAAKEREITVASFNLDNFFDDEANSTNLEKELIVPKKVFEGRLKKASLAIRNVLSMPDVLGIVEVENLIALKKLADKINADAIEAKQPNPAYVAYLEEGNDFRGIDVGFLIKSAKVKTIEIKQLGKEAKLDAAIEKPKDDAKPQTDGEKSKDEEKLNDDEEKSGDKLFDRTPLLIRASVDNKGKPFEFTTIVNHIKSYLGVDDPKKGETVRNKRRLQSEWLANFIQERRKVNPTERLIVCGDFNAYEFSDGYNDLIGTLIGKPSPNVVAPTKTVFQTGLVDLITSLPKASKYSYVHEGNAQAIDHILINEPTFKNALFFNYARIDADFPVSYYNDFNRPERVSDHDGAVFYMTLDDKK